MKPEATLSDAEWKVMHAVWGRGPCTARQVLEDTEAETAWAYSTVKTLLNRLVEKGALSSHTEGITSVYTPQVDRAAAQRQAAGALADKAFEGAFGSMMHFLVGDRRLSAKQRDALRALLDEEDA